MTRRIALRLISLGMFLAAIIFVCCAISAPTLGSVIYFGPFEFGVEQWRVCYALYALIMAGLFIASFFVKPKKRE